MEYFVAWLLISIVTAIAASSRGRSAFGWFLIACFLNLLALILVLVLPNLKTEAEKPNPKTHVKCPDCRELVLKEAKRCKHCGITLIPQ